MAYPNGTGDENIASQYYIAARGVQGDDPLDQANSINYMKKSSVSVSLKLPFTSNQPNCVDTQVRTLFDKNCKIYGTSYYGGWLNYHYHGLSGSGPNPDLGENTTGPDIVRAMLNILDQNRDKVWVGTFTDIAMYGQERDTHTLDVTTKNSDLIKFTLSDEMDDTLFDYPLTVKVRVNDDWDHIAATQNGSSIPVSVITHDSNKYALVKAVPDRGEVELFLQSNPIPSAPRVTANDVSNEIMGLDLSTMEYAISTNGGSTYGGYTSETLPSLGGSKMVKVRIKASGQISAGADAVLTFTPNAGDINGNGIINIADVIMTAEIAVGNTNYTPGQVILANVSDENDPSVDIADVVLIAERAVGGATAFAVE